MSEPAPPPESAGGPGSGGLPEPSRRLAPAARVAWRFTGAAYVPLIVILAGSIVERGPGGAFGAAVWAAAGIGSAVLVLVVPELRWRRWRYEIREHEVDIRHGLFTIRRTLVPMPRVQHVDTERGVLQQMLGLATVAFHTAAGKTEIPQLAVDDADQARDRIAELARTSSDVI